MMKFILLLLLIGGYTCLAQDTPRKWHLSVASGYQQSALRWSIAGNANGQHPNVLSELKWESIGGPVTGIHLRYNFIGHWQLTGEYEHSFFLSGKVSDKDYGGNNRTNPVYAQQFQANKGGANRWQAGLACQLPVTHVLSVTPSAGYAQFNQALYLSGSADLNSSYKTSWKGPYGQVDCSTRLTKQLSMQTGFRYSQVYYRASANWNLIREFSHPESFRHTANGYGINLQTGIFYLISDKHAIGITGSYAHWQTGRGIDELYLVNGGSEQTQLNEVRSASWQVMAQWRISL